jgi:hypothetical protein
MSTSHDCTTADTFRKEIKYDHESRDYALYLNDELVGYARTYHDGELALDALALAILTHQHTSQEAA